MYKRRKGTEKDLKFICGGRTGSLYAAWDYIAANSPTELITLFIATFNKGNHLKKSFNNAMNSYQLSNEDVK